MGLSKYKINELISVCDERNSYGYTNFCGLNINKEFMPTWANTEGLDESKYKVVRKKRFVFSGMQTGRDECIRISMYNGEEPIIVSPAYTTFEVTREDLVLPEYFFMLFLSKEKDRYGAFCSDGSIRSNLDWDRFCDFNITLPSIELQRKYVDVYLSLQNNLATYQSKVDDLKLVCDGYIEDLRKKVKCEKLGKYIKEENVRNIDNSLNNVLGVCKEKTFISTIANMHGIDLHNYKVVKTGWFAYSNRINIGSVALRYGSPCLVSPSYTVFSVDETKLYPEYLSLWLQRDEFLHFAFFYSMGTVKDELGVEDLGEMVIPFPDLQTQLYILDIYKAYIERQRIVAQLKEQLNNLCPILIKGSLQN